MEKWGKRVGEYRPKLFPTTTDTFKATSVIALAINSFRKTDTIGEGLINFTKENGLDFKDVKILGGDSTPVNTGRFAGAFAYIEQTLHITFHRFICILHIF